MSKSKTCSKCSSVFVIKDEDLVFYDKVSPVFNGVKCSIPEPKSCPDCRQQRRLSFINPRKLYNRQCMKPGCNTEFKTTYSPDRPEIVYCEKCYREEVY